MYAEKGERHPGYDCFVFKRSLYPKFNLGLLCIGAVYFDRCLYINFLLNSDKFAEFKDLYLTFHLGDDRRWTNKKLKDYRLHNSKEIIKIIRKYEEIQQLRDDRFAFFERAVGLADRLEQDQKWYSFIIKLQRLFKNWLVTLLDNGKR
ncbi:MAG: hypothetical protein F6K23_28910 [Okeania sp. SIO2C9]|uniref:hypothetical protein n=1 Tax=Okeania sp. SIO2C9 TaxID=2607791 RepID=UPI0013BF9F8D|nr:hypothetical protein [Okeania sp. SIO2C9]NEQ76704.1 hypothetical protein [Okeania sp. SIO2C9]